MGNYRSIIVLALASTLTSWLPQSVALAQISGIDHYRARLGYENQNQQRSPRPVQRRTISQPQTHATIQRAPAYRQRVQQRPRARALPQAPPNPSTQQRRPSTRSIPTVRPTNHQLPLRTNSNPFQADRDVRSTRQPSSFSLPSQQSRINWSNRSRLPQGNPPSRGTPASPVSKRAPHFGRLVKQQIDDIFGEDQVPGQVVEDPDVFGEGQAPPKPPVNPPVPDNGTEPTKAPDRTPKPPVVPDANSMEPTERNGVVLPPDAFTEPGFLDGKNDVPGIIPDQKLPRPGSVLDSNDDRPENSLPERNGNDTEDENAEDDRPDQQFNPDVYDPADPRNPNANNGPESWYRPGAGIRRHPNTRPYNPNLYGTNPASLYSGYGSPYPGYGAPYPGYAPPHPGYAPPHPGYAPQYPGYAPPYPGYPPQYPGYAAPPGYSPQTGAYSAATAAANSGVYSQPSICNSSCSDVNSSVCGCDGATGCSDGCGGGYGNGIVNGLLESTFYLSLFGGYSNLTPVTISDSTGDFRIDAGDGYLLGAALGQYQGLNLRTEIEFSFRDNDLISVTSPSDSAFVPPNFENAGVRSYAGMANAIWEFIEFPSNRVKPYVGAGFGFVNVEAQAEIGEMSAFEGIDSSDSSFGYQAFAGLNFQANETLDVFAEYRYMKADSLQLGDFGFDYETSNVFGGLRVKF